MLFSLGTDLRSTDSEAADDDTLGVLAVPEELDGGVRVSGALPIGKLRMNVAHAPSLAWTGSFPPPLLPFPLPRLLLHHPSGGWSEGPWTVSISTSVSSCGGEDSS